MAVNLKRFLKFMVMILFVVFVLYVVYEYSMGSNNGKHYEGYTEGGFFPQLPAIPGKMTQAQQKVIQQAQNPSNKGSNIFGRR